MVVLAFYGWTSLLPPPPSTNHRSHLEWSFELIPPGGGEGSGGPMHIITLQHCIHGRCTGGDEVVVGGGGRERVERGAGMWGGGGGCKMLHSLPRSQNLSSKFEKWQWEQLFFTKFYIRCNSKGFSQKLFYLRS